MTTAHNSAVAVQPSMWPLMSLRECSAGEADDLLTRWEHPLGPCNRPFEQRDFVLEIEGETIAMATSASTVSGTCAGEPRNTLVELARIARHPKHPFILRVMLRLWRVYLARQHWASWRPVAAVSYAIPGMSGDVYRFDGWERIGKVKPSSGGGTWTKKDPKVASIGDGVKTLWIYRYEETDTDEHALPRRDIAAVPTADGARDLGDGAGAAPATPGRVS